MVVEEEEEEEEGRMEATLATTLAMQTRASAK